MGLSFSQYLILHEIFGRSLSLSESVGLFDPKTIAQDRLSKVQNNYQPSANHTDDIAAACAGLKPAAIVNYLHHPDSPAAQIVSDDIKTGKVSAGAIQSELLKHGFKVRPDFHIIHMNLPGYTNRNIIIGGKAAVEELWQIYQCQYYLDMISSPDHPAIDQTIMNKVTRMLKGTCYTHGNCSMGNAGINCKPFHKRIGQLLGYPEAEIQDFLGKSKGFDHIPDIYYPSGLPQSLETVPKKKEFK